MKYYEFGSLQSSAIIMSRISEFDKVNQRAYSLERENQQNISDYNNLLARYRLVNKKYNGLVNEWNELDSANVKLSQDHCELIEKYNNLVTQFNALAESSDSILNELNNLKIGGKSQSKIPESQVIRLKEELSNIQKVTSQTITDVNHQNAILKTKLVELQEYKSTSISNASKNKETYAKEVKKRTRDNAKNELALKVTTIQTKIFRLLCENSLSGVEKQDFIKHQIDKENEADNSKNVFSYTDAYTWLKRNDKDLLSRIDLLSMA